MAHAGRLKARACWLHSCSLIRQRGLFVHCALPFTQEAEAEVDLCIRMICLGRWRGEPLLERSPFSPSGVSKPAHCTGNLAATES